MTLTLLNAESLIYIGMLIAIYLLVYRDPETRWFSGIAVLCVGIILIVREPTEAIGWIPTLLIAPFIIFNKNNIYQAFEKDDKMRKINVD